MARTGASWVRRHGYLVLCLGLVALFMATFVVVEALRLPLLTEPREYLDAGSAPVAAVGVGLLLADVVLPVPASGIMIAHGAAFGFVLGSILSLVGGTGAALGAFVVGRRSQRLVDRLVSADQQRRADELLRRHGVWAIIATRPVPMFAETVGILAGTGRTLPWWKVAVAGAVGNLVPAVAYAAVGAYAASFVNSALVFAAVVLVAGLAWLVQRSPGGERPVPGLAGVEPPGAG
jgi:uncharacterized membrane protein YdjX (TVP38/TMEM64 family)